MPDLRQISCAIEIGPTNVKLPEYLAAYQDGKVEVHVPVPDTDLAFSIHTTARGYIAPGLAAFVFIDGEYQCNRNQFGFDDSLSNDDAQVDFRLRQKEEQTCADRFIGREWTFQALKFGSTSDETGRDKDHFEINVGKIEVIILRCRMSGDVLDTGLKPLGYEPQEHIKENGDHVYEASQNHVPSGKKRRAQRKKSKAAPTTAQASIFGGLSGLFDGAADEPLYYSNFYAPDDRVNAWRNAPYPQNTPALWHRQHANSAPWPAHHVVNDYPPQAPPRNDWSQHVPMPGNEFYPPIAGTYNMFPGDTRGQSDWRLPNPHEATRGRPIPQQYNDWRPHNMAQSDHYHNVDLRHTFQHPTQWDASSNQFNHTYGYRGASLVQIDKHEAKVLEQRFRYLQTEKEQVQGRVADVKKALDERKSDFAGCESVNDMLALRDVLEEQERAKIQELNILTTRLNLAGINVGALVVDSKTDDKQPTSPTKTTRSHRDDDKKSTRSKRDSRANSHAKTSSKKSTTSDKRSRATSPAKSTSGNGGWPTTTNDNGGWSDASNEQNGQSSGWDNADNNNTWNNVEKSKGESKPSGDQNRQSGGWDDSADKSKGGESKPSDSGKKGASAVADGKKGVSHNMKLADSQSYWRDWRRVNQRTAGNTIEPLARPVYCAPAEDLPTVHDRVQSQGVTHGVRTGPGAEYCHHIQRPQYIDSMSSPYAVFTFHYRDRATLEKLLPKSKDGLEELSEINAELERQSLHTKPREWLIRQLSMARKSNGATSARQSTPTTPATKAGRVDESGSANKPVASQTNAWNADGWNQEGPAEPNVNW